MELVGHRAEESAVMQKEGSNGVFRVKMWTYEWVPAMVFTMRLSFQRQARGRIKISIFDVIPNLCQKLSLGRMEIVSEIPHWMPGFSSLHAEGECYGKTFGPEIKRCEC